VNNQHSPDQDSEVSSTGTPVIEKSKPIDPIPPEPATAEQLTEVEKQMTGFEKATLRWAKIAVLLSGLAAVFVCAQWYEMHEGGKDTRALANAANTQANKMTDMSIASEKIRKAAEDMVTQDQRIADNAQKTMDASNKQAKAALDITIDNFQRDQRAWVGLGKSQVTFGPNEPFTLNIPMINSGKTPAILTQASITPGFGITPPSGPPQNYPKHFNPAGTIAPQGQFTLSITDTDFTKAYEGIKAGQIVIFFFGIFTYKDVYNPQSVHTTDFCLIYNPQTNVMFFCSNGNDMN
jgi:hypothetical protein